MAESTLQWIVTALLSAISALITWRIAVEKTRADLKINTRQASDALRDDLIALIDRYEKREEALLQRLKERDKTADDLQTQVSNLRTEIAVLRQENVDLKAELQRTRKELEAFERKVYYIPKEGDSR